MDGTYEKAAKDHIRQLLIEHGIDPDGELTLAEQLYSDTVIYGETFLHLIRGGAGALRVERVDPATVTFEVRPS